MVCLTLYNGPCAHDKKNKKVLIYVFHSLKELLFLAILIPHKNPGFIIIGQYGINDR